jgi:hypothetical protein
VNEVLPDLQVREVSRTLDPGRFIAHLVNPNKGHRAAVADAWIALPIEKPEALPLIGTLEAALYPHLGYG